MKDERFRLNKLAKSLESRGHTEQAYAVRGLAKKADGAAAGLVDTVGGAATGVAAAGGAAAGGAAAGVAAAGHLLGDKGTSESSLPGPPDPPEAQVGPPAPLRANSNDFYMIGADGKDFTPNSISRIPPDGTLFIRKVDGEEFYLAVNKKGKPILIPLLQRASSAGGVSGQGTMTESEERALLILIPKDREESWITSMRERYNTPGSPGPKATPGMQEWEEEGAANMASKSKQLVTNRTSGNKFRAWIHKAHPEYIQPSGIRKLDRRGSWDNKYMSAAWDAHGEEYSKSGGPQGKPPAPSAATSGAVSASMLFNDLKAGITDLNLCVAMVANAIGESGLNYTANGDCGKGGKGATHSKSLDTSLHPDSFLSPERNGCCSFGLWQYNICAGLGKTLLEANGANHKSSDEDKIKILTDYKKQVDFMIGHTNKKAPSKGIGKWSVDKWVEWFVYYVEMPKDKPGATSSRQRIARNRLKNFPRTEEQLAQKA